MLDDPNTQDAAPAPHVEQSMRRNLRVLLVWSTATIVLELGVFVLAALAGARRADALLATLATCLVWTALAAPALAAGGGRWLSSLMRAGVMADASAISLLAIYFVGLGRPPAMLSLMSLLQVYLMLLALALTAAASVCCARGVVARHGLAAACSAAMMLTMSSPFWINGLVHQAQGGQRERIVRVAVELNPFYSVTESVVLQTHMVWHQAPVLYHITRIGEYEAPGPIRWYDAVVNFLAIAAFLAAVAVVRRWMHATPPALSSRRE